jgi:tight adherence protein B
MTPLSWLALAFAVLVVASPAPAPARVGALAGLGRLIEVDAGTRQARRIPTLWLVGVVAAGGVVGTVFAGGVALAVAAAAVCAAAWFMARDIARRRVAATRHAQLLASLRLVIAELDAGARPSAALAAAAEAGPSHEGVFGAASAAAAQRRDAAAILLGDDATRAIGLAWRLGEDTGVALAGVLSRVALDLAAEDEQRRSVDVALAGPRASAALLTGLPLLGIGLGAAMGARPWEFLLGASTGRAVCCAGVLLDIAGVLWMRRILRRAERA